MATIKYQCSVCKRFIQKRENLQGLTVFGKCIITDGCLGKLSKIERNIDNFLEDFPISSSGLIDYTSRKALFSHTQEILSKNWIIKHNLASFPAVIVYIKDVAGNISQLDQDKYTVSSIDKNTINISFLVPTGGIVQCIARTVDNKIISNTIKKEDIRVTTNGLITMALPVVIINSDPFLPNVNLELMSFQMEFLIKKPSENEIASLENITTAIDGRSPWNNFPKILIKNRKNYVIRTKNIFSLLAFGTNATINDIPNGTRIRFNRLFYPNLLPKFIESKELLFMLSKSPFTILDKVRDKFIDVGELIGTEIDYFIYRDGELYIDNSIVETTYPDIKKAK